MSAKILLLPLAVRGREVMAVSPRRLTARVVGTQRISAGSFHTCAIRADDSLAERWGQDSYGRSTVSPNVPYTQISAGDTNTCAIRADNSLAECWGNPSSINDYGQSTVSPNVPFTQISVAAFHTSLRHPGGQLARGVLGSRQLRAEHRLAKRAIRAHLDGTSPHLRHPGGQLARRVLGCKRHRENRTK